MYLPRMEDYTSDGSYYQRVIKKDLEDTGRNDYTEEKIILSATKASSVKETNNLFDIKLELGAIQETEVDELLLQNNCKVDRSVHFKESIMKSEKFCNDDPGLNEIIHSSLHEQSSKTIKIESTFGDNHHIVSKTEDEEGVTNKDTDLNSLLSATNKAYSNLINIKLEPEIKHENENEEMMLAHKSKFETEVETYDEFCNADARSIMFEESNQSLQMASSSSKIETGTKMDKQVKNTCDKKIFRCDECDFVTYYNSALKKHQIAKHTDIRPFKCDRCDYTAKIKNHLREHQLKHTEERSHRCDECDFITFYRSSLKKHQIAKHTELRPFKCDKCDYTAKIGTHLKEHQLKHTEVRSLRCNECDFVTYYRSSLKKHQIVKHTEMRPFKCDKCAFQAKTKYNLKLHERKHLDPIIECDHCDYKTKTLDHLRRHLVRHDKWRSENVSL